MRRGFEWRRQSVPRWGEMQSVWGVEQPSMGRQAYRRLCFRTLLGWCGRIWQEQAVTFVEVAKGQALQPPRCPQTALTCLVFLVVVMAEGPHFELEGQA